MEKEWYISKYYKEIKIYGYKSSLGFNSFTLVTEDGRIYVLDKDWENLYIKMVSRDLLPIYEQNLQETPLFKALYAEL